MLHSMTIEYEDDILLGLGLSPHEFTSEAKFLLAAKLYELGRLTSGQAARLCGQGRVQFLTSLLRASVPVSNLAVDDADIELLFANHD